MMIDYDENDNPVVSDEGYFELVKSMAVALSQFQEMGVGKYLYLGYWDQMSLQAIEAANELKEAIEAELKKQ